LTGDDFDAALAFYRDTLGLEVRDMWVAEGSRGVLLEAGRATVELFDEGQAAMVEQNEGGRRVAGTVRIAFEVDDSRTTSDELIEAGAELLGGPVETPWHDVNVRLCAPRGMPAHLIH